MQLCPDAAAEAPHTGSGKERKLASFTREKTKLDDVAERFESREGHFNKVFLATEEEETLAAFRAALGEDLLYVDQKRIRGYQKRDPQIRERFQPPLGERMALGEKYLYIIWCLSRCGALINNVYCGSFEIARRLREGRGEQFRSLP